MLSPNFYRLSLNEFSRGASCCSSQICDDRGPSTHVFGRQEAFSLQNKKLAATKVVRLIWVLPGDNRRHSFLFHLFRADSKLSFSDFRLRTGLIVRMKFKWSGSPAPSNGMCVASSRRSQKIHGSAAEPVAPSCGRAGTDAASERKALLSGSSRRRRESAPKRVRSASIRAADIESQRFLRVRFRNVRTSRSGRSSCQAAFNSGK